MLKVDDIVVVVVCAIEYSSQLTIIIIEVCISSLVYCVLYSFGGLFYQVVVVV